VVASNIVTYRITIHSTTEEVDIMCFDIGCIDTSVLGHYVSINETPQWVQERIAVLMMTDPTPPTEEVDAVGRRIDRSTYWVYHE
jgi:hypothetical protein